MLKSRMSREDSKIRDRKIRDVERERRQEEKDNGLGIGWAMLDDELTALKAERERDELILLSQTRQQEEEETQEAAAEVSLFFID